MIKVLIVEDNDADFRLASEYLKEDSFTSFDIARACDLKSALEFISKINFDVTVIDLDLPDSIGLNTIDAISDTNPALPIVVLTGLNDDKAGLLAIHKKAQDYLTKGRITSDLLIKSIQYAIERKRTETVYINAANEWQRTFDSIPDFIAIIDNDHRILRINNAMAERLGSDVQQYKEMFCYKCVHKTKGPPKNCPHELMLKDGKEHIEEIFEENLGGYFLVSTTPILDERGKLVGSVHVARDITKNKRAEEVLKRDKETLEKLIRERSKALLDAQIELERSKRLSDIGTLASTVAHELRNPLAAISLATANIKKKSKDPNLDKHIATIEKKITESSQIINNLLFYSRIKHPTYEEISVLDVINECADLVKKLSFKNVLINKKTENLKNAKVKADPTQMKELFSNILNNSFDAVSDSNAKIDIIGVKENGFVKISVNDNGVGIGKADLERVFDPFFTTKSKGTGLGLSVSNQIVNLHGGSIQIESELGYGTSVIVRLPCEAK